MDFRNSRTSLFSQILCLTLVFSFLAGCSQQQGTDTSSNSSNPSDTSAASPGGETKSESNTPPATDPAKVDFTEMIGTTADGWMPKVLKDTNLKKNMKPEEVGKAIPGAEKTSEFGFSEAMVKDVPGLQKYEFYFAKDDSGKPTKLEAVKLHFDPSLNNEESYKKLVDALVKKYGEAKPEDIEKQLITWVGPNFATAQLTKGLSQFEGYTLNVSIPE